MPKGNITSANTTLTSQTTHNVSHNQDVGSNRHLIVVAECKGNTVGFNLTAKYNGVSMNAIASENVGAGNDVALRIFELEDATEGTNNVEFRWGGFSYSGDLRWYIVSYTDCNDVANAGSNKSNSGSPVSVTLGANVKAGSDIIAIAYAQGTFVDGEEIEIPTGTLATMPVNSVASSGVNSGEISIALEEGVSAGSLTSETSRNSPFGNFGALLVAEIELASPVSNDGNFFSFF